MLTRRRVTPALFVATIALITSCSAGETGPPPGTGGPRAADGYLLEQVVTGTALHSLNGITLRSDGRIVAACLASETITEIDPGTGVTTTLVEAPEGRSDDVVVTASGDVLFTDPLAGAVKRRAGDGSVRVVADGLPRVNSIAYDRAATRLVVGQTFLADAVWEIDPDGAEPKRLVAEGIGQLNAFAFGPDGQIYAPVGSARR